MWEICLFSLFIIYSIIYLYQYGIVDIYFIIWVTLQFYIFVFAAPIIAALAIGSSFRLAPVPRLFFEHTLTFCAYRILQAHRVYLPPQP